MRDETVGMCEITQTRQVQCEDKAAEERLPQTALFRGEQMGSQPWRARRIGKEREEQQKPRRVYRRKWSALGNAAKLTHRYRQIGAHLMALEKPVLIGRRRAKPDCGGD